MEYWVPNRDDILIFIFNAAHLYKIRSSFSQTQYSNIPLFQHPMAFDYAKSGYL